MRKLIYRILPRTARVFLKRLYYNNFVLPKIKKENKIEYGYSDFFNIINIETTTYCNLRCKFCPNSIYDRGILKNKKLMDTNFFKKIIDELASINFCGGIALQLYGEPLSDERMPELINYVRNKCPKSYITVNTNGFFLTIPLYKTLVKSGLNNLLISQYNDSVQPNYKQVMKYLETRPKEENKITYRVFDGKVGSPAVCNRGGEIKVNRLPDMPSCVYPKKVVHVDYAGNVILCGHDYHSSFIFGNLKKECLINIWNSPKYKQIRNELNDFKFNLNICKRCVGEL